MPQAPLIPYQEPRVEDGALLEQPVLDLLDLDYEAATQVFAQHISKMNYTPVKMTKKRTYKQAMLTC